MKRLKEDIQHPVLSFYQALPSENLNYQKFKDKAFERFRILKKIENNIKDVECIKNLEDDFNGHFCLKVLCAQSKWSSIWFTNHETQLFKARLKKNPEEGKQFFIESVWPYLNVRRDIDYNTNYSLSHTNNKDYDTDIRVHFSKCSEILAERTQKMKEGYFQMSDAVMEAFLTSEFKRVLEKSMLLLYEKCLINSDERILKLGKEILFDNSAAAEPTSSINALNNTQYFPLCIQGIIQNLTKNRHLKYNDRQALCLFLKDVGISLNDCISFFKAGFKCTAEEFTKLYLYNIRHNYGMEGKKANYGCFSCGKMISFTNDPNSFGCPFIKNHDFVKMNADIEDFSGGPIKCCSQVAAKIVGKDVESKFNTPAEYFKMLVKELNLKQE